MRTRLLLVLALLGSSLVAGGSAHAAALVSLGPAAATWGGTGSAFSPIAAGSPTGDPRLFVVQRGGVVRIVLDGVVRPTPFLTVPGIDTSGERGLLGIAFPPDYATTGRFYVFASIAGSPAQTRILEYGVSADPNVADPASARIVLTQDVTAGSANHNGGGLLFGPDGLLYATLGDDAKRAMSQDPVSQLGKVLRIDPADPDGAGPLTYTVPATNPFAGSPVWALGFRNPFRAAFDPAGRLIVADVGEGTWEEVNVVASGANHGWPTCEGNACSPSAPAGLTGPFYVYNQDDAAPLGGCSVIGGVVVRDPRVTTLVGRYLLGDFCQRQLRSIDLGVAGGDVRVAGRLLTLNNGGPIGFAEDARGCAYVLADGTVYRVANEATDPVACTLKFPAPPADPIVPTTPIVSPAPVPAPPAPAPVPGVTPPTRVVVPKNCVRDGRMSIAAKQGRITKVRLVRGKKVKTLRLARSGGRVVLAGLPTGKVKLRLTVKTKRGRTVRVEKNYKACA